MRVPVLRALQAVSSHIQPQSCRFIAGRRLTPGKNTFRTSSRQRREDDPTETNWPAIDDQPQPPEVARPHEQPAELEGLLFNREGGPDTPSRPKDKNKYGSASRRAGRNVKRVKELPPVNIPSWFLERNVNPQLGLRSWKHHDFEGPESGVQHGSLQEILPGTTLLDENVMQEVRSVISAGLQVHSSQRAELAASLNPHPVLFCPEDGAERILEGFICDLAAENGTDLLVLGPQDIAEIGGDYMDEPADLRDNTLSSLGYDAQTASSTRVQQASHEFAEENEHDEEDEEITYPNQIPFKHGSGIRAGGIAVVNGASFGGNLQDVFKFLAPPNGSPQKNRPITLQNGPQSRDVTPDMKMGLLVETILNAPQIKRTTKDSNILPAAVPGSGGLNEDNTSKSVSPLSENSDSPSVSPSLTRTERVIEGLIVFVQDFPQINSTISGNSFLNKLEEAVDMRRKDGQSVLIVGGTSSKTIMSSLTWSAAQDLQNQLGEGSTRNIVVPASNKRIGLPDLEYSNKKRFKDINIRHLLDMLRRTAPNFDQVSRVVALRDLEIDSKTSFLSGLEESVWSMARVSRIVTVALGILDDSENIDNHHFERALNIVELSDSTKKDWLDADNETRNSWKKWSSSTQSDANSKDRMKSLRKSCNAYEKKLLNGVVNPEDIRTTFSDVQAPMQTKEALVTLTSLSLMRPDAFTYGVLATDKIPGLLLYGPPGTGKTLLAKAVAKESGATVLEVSGSDVYDMYVGEGEKNVKAIFTLAKKLIPCIVFIDEADAILGARSGGSNRTSHRELINQFLREWDGMNETSAFIMVATNRPFDLDEACLRRLPRRLLVDLPQEKDREAILKIHLKEEMLDPEVSISQLASQTPFYSGSDLKNVAVAAALACVREEFDTATSHNKEASNGDKYEYAKKRTLHARHFTRAMEEISASISEDMGSLSAIRKFDEKYGDRKGRRKKGGYGFKTVADSERQESDAARVRNQT